MAQGALSRTPLLHVVLSLAQREMTGTLVLWPPEGTRRGQDRVWFESGWPLAARFVEPASRLDIGLLALFARQSGAYAFYGENLVGAQDTVTGRLDPWALAAASLRLGAPESRMEEVLARWHGTPLRLRTGFRVGRLALLPEEEAILDLLRAEPTPLEGLLRVAPDAERARRLVYLLILLDGLVPHGAEHVRSPRSEPGSSAAPFEGVERGRAASSSSPSTSPGPVDSGEASQGASPRASLRPGAQTGRAAVSKTPPAPPEGLSEGHRRRWEGLLDLASRLEGADDFAALGLEPMAGLTEQDVERAYLAVARRCHPDSLPAPLHPLEPWARRIFHRITEARDRLRSEEGRERVLRALREGRSLEELEEEARQVGVVVEAALELSKIQALVRTRQWSRAWEVLERLRAAAPREPEVLAWWAYVCWHTHGERPEELARAEEALEAALRLDADCWRAHLWLGQLRRQGGRWKEALAHFERAARIVPKEVEVARELRVARLRLARDADAAPGGEPEEAGLFDRLFARRGRRNE